jgi:hypothetical protein
VILEITLEKNIISGRCRISSVGVHPTWVHIKKENSKYKHTIVPLLNFNADIFSQSEITLMMQAKDDTQEQLSGFLKTKIRREAKSVQ